MKIDFHNHFYPPEYLKRLEQWGRSYRIYSGCDRIEDCQREGSPFSLGSLPNM